MNADDICQDCAAAKAEAEKQNEAAKKLAEAVRAWMDATKKNRDNELPQLYETWALACERAWDGVEKALAEWEASHPKP